MNAAARGFPRDEFESRCAHLQKIMAAYELDGLLVTAPPNFRYITGFDTEFWESPTRPWFVVIPADGLPVAIVPELGGPALSRTWIDDVRVWPAPRPEDDGVTLLTEALSALPKRFGRVGAELGREQVLRMPAIDLDRVRQNLAGTEIVDGSPVLWQARLVKSEAEIERIAHVCDLASVGFESLESKLTAGISVREACRRFRIDLLERGADAVPFMAAAAGPGGYDEIISAPGDRPIENGDILIIDTGATYDGYFCDFDRNFAFGGLDDSARRAHEIVWEATEAGIAAARPGATAADLWRAMNAVLEKGGAIGNNVGRLGHGLGLQLTEPPSNRPGDETKLVPGMVMTIEPGMEYAPGKMIVHEENLVIREGPAQLLTRRAPRAMWTV